MEQQLKEAQEWLAKGWHDLVSARSLLCHEPEVTDTIAFHCQQAVEKALKAYLVYYGRTFDRVHNLGYLLDICGEIDEVCEQLRNAAEVLTPYGVGARYPGEIEDISEEQATEALKSADYVWDNILALLPAEVTQRWRKTLPGSNPLELPGLNSNPLPSSP
jgi:HEPN domain-containing protein